MKVLKKSIVDGVLTLTYEKIEKELKIKLADFPKANHEEAEEHGYLQRFGDLESGDETGHLKFDAAVELAAHYKAGGDWRMTAGSRDTTAIVIEALGRINPRKYSKAKLEKVAAAKPEEVKVWRSHPQVRAEIAKIYAEKAAARASESKDELEIDLT